MYYEKFSNTCEIIKVMKIKEHNHQLKKLLIVQHILLVSTLRNV